VKTMTIICAAGEILFRIWNKGSGWQMEREMQREIQWNAV